MSHNAVNYAWYSKGIEVSLTVSQQSFNDHKFD
jgi:hypothetical protein